MFLTTLASSGVPFSLIYTLKFVVHVNFVLFLHVECFAGVVGILFCQTFTPPLSAVTASKHTANVKLKTAGPHSQYNTVLSSVYVLCLLDSQINSFQTSKTLKTCFTNRFIDVAGKV